MHLPQRSFLPAPPVHTLRDSATESTSCVCFLRCTSSSLAKSTLLWQKRQTSRRSSSCGFRAEYRLETCEGCTGPDGAEAARGGEGGVFSEDEASSSCFVSVEGGDPCFSLVSEIFFSLLVGGVVSGEFTVGDAVSVRVGMEGGTMLAEPEGDAAVAAEVTVAAGAGSGGRRLATTGSMVVLGGKVNVSTRGAKGSSSPEDGGAYIRRCP